MQSPRSRRPAFFRCSASPHRDPNRTGCSPGSSKLSRSDTDRRKGSGCCSPREQLRRRSRAASLCVLPGQGPMQLSRDLSHQKLKSRSSGEGVSDRCSVRRGGRRRAGARARPYFEGGPESEAPGRPPQAFERAKPARLPARDHAGGGDRRPPPKRPTFERAEPARLPARDHAGGGDRTRKGVASHRILSPARLPVPPLRPLRTRRADRPSGSDP